MATFEVNFVKIDESLLKSKQERSTVNFVLQISHNSTVYRVLTG